MIEFAHLQFPTYGPKHTFLNNNMYDLVAYVDTLALESEGWQSKTMCEAFHAVRRTINGPYPLATPQPHLIPLTRVETSTFHQRDLQAIKEVLSYTSPAFEHAVIVTHIMCMHACLHYVLNTQAATRSFSLM